MHFNGANGVKHNKMNQSNQIKSNQRLTVDCVAGGHGARVRYANIGLQFEAREGNRLTNRPNGNRMNI